MCGGAVSPKYSRAAAQLCDGRRPRPSVGGVEWGSYLRIYRGNSRFGAGGARCKPHETCSRLPSRKSHTESVNYRPLKSACPRPGFTRTATRMSHSYLFTSESVSEGHPDKVADQISDAVLDAILSQDKRARVACETLVKTGVAVVAGEVTTNAWVDLEELVRRVICDIGYTSSDVGFDGKTCGILNVIGKQSPDINQGVDRGDPENQGAGDQGLMFGYATKETRDYMPAAIHYAHRLVEQQSKVRKSKKNPLPWLRPDAKSQVTLRYEDGEVAAIDAVVLSTQHDPSVKLADLKEGVMEEIIKP